jgi:predicted RNase H-like HicB family nuclease
MICDVLLTKKDKKFIARVCQYPEIMAEGDTEKGVLEKARVSLKELLAGGRMVKIDTESGPCEHPWLKYAGMFADDPDWEDFQESLRQYRDEIDSVEDGA